MTSSPTHPLPDTGTDPWLWLEDVHGSASLDWVKAQNAQSEAALQADPGFEARRQAIREALDSDQRIPAVSRRGDWLYNLWTDAEHPRGLWRRTTLANYAQAQPAWETVLDIDALGHAEGENWVWGGAVGLGATHQRCLLMLSRGGADAVVVREFDTVAKAFVEGGFSVPEAKTSVTWLDIDTVYIGSDFGPGSLTDSGYPRQVRRWQRGQPLAEAPLVFEGRSDDMTAYAWVDPTPGHERRGFGRMIDFYTSEVLLLQQGQPVVVPKPADAELSFWREFVLVSLRSAAHIGGQDWPAGSLLAAPAEGWLAGSPQPVALFTPSASCSLAAMATTRGTVLLTLLDNVASRIEAWQPSADGWRHSAVDAPAFGSLSAAPLHEVEMVDDPLAEHWLLSSSSFIEPSRLTLRRTGSDESQPLKALPAFFDASGMRVEQHAARSADGTAVPYFVIWPRDAEADGRNPTLLYGYGGFEVSLSPWYLGSDGRASWVAQGGVFVVANIRGGGEFGPAWHQAALTHQRQRAYDDFIAVAEDLIARGITRPPQLGIQGGSNGGLLVGAVMLQRPDLFGAVVCQVPLLDMRRYHRLLAGASWMAEYGNPDDPADWAAIAAYSPYQRLQQMGAGQALPPVLFTTSTRDDRVHPGHARKMAACMQALGYTPLYWENIEGGHGGAADNGQRARMRALEQTFLWQRLGRH